MTARPVTVSTVAYDGYPLATAIRGIAALGMPLVEPAYIKGYMDFDETDFSDAAARRVSALMETSGVGAVAVSAHMDIGDAEATAMLARRIRFTAGIGARFTITNSTNIDRRDALRRTISANLPLAEALGVVIALENPGHGPANLMRDGAAGASLVASLASPWVAMNYDTANALTCTEGAVRPEAEVAAALPFCAHLHLKDVMLQDARWRYTAIGGGSIDYPALLAQLKPYPGIPLCLELPLRLRRTMHRDPVREERLVPLDAIESAIQSSWRFVTERLGDVA